MTSRIATLKRILTPLAISAAWVFFSNSVFADGILIPPPDIPMRDAFAIKYHRVKVEVSDGVVTTVIDQAFENLTGRRIEADYVFPIPHDAVLQDFAMWVGGERITGKILSASEARKIYEDIVRSQRDPALLEYIGNDAFRARVFPIEAGEVKRIQLSYAQVLEADNGVYEYVYPLNTEKFSAQLIGEVTVSGRVETSIPIKTIYSPSHAISVTRNEDKRASFRYEASNVRPDTDFILYYSVDAREIGASLLAFDDDDSEDGFFVSTITPRVERETKKVINKNFIFVLDKSGSMQDDDKISQAKNALRFVLRNLNEGDRFNVVAYSDELTECFKGGMKTWSSKTRDDALDFVRGFDAMGGTNINEALLRSLEILDNEGGKRPSYIIFLTDGLPTVGVTDEGSIITNVTNANRRGARLFAFGVGYDVNTHLLDKLSEGNHGVTEYVSPGEDIEVAVSNFYSKISSPVLTDVSISFKGAKVRDLYPKEMPDLFHGNQVIISGRYKPGATRATIELTGSVDGKTKNFSFPVSFSSRTSYSFVPRIWAGRKIGYLTDEIRLHGSNDELISEIVRLSKRYGIITEYTSFLIREDDIFFAPVEEAEGALSSNIGTYADMDTGAGAVGQAKTTQRLKGQADGGQGNASAPTAYYDISGEEVEVTTIEYIDNLTFFLVDDYWTDSRFDPDGQVVTEIMAYSDAYFALLDESPALGKYVALGDQVILVLDDDSALKISLDSGSESLSKDRVENIGKMIASNGNSSGRIKLFANAESAQPGERGGAGKVANNVMNALILVIVGWFAWRVFTGRGC